MNKSIACASLLTFALAICGCSTNQMYYWGQYDDDFYQYYKNPAKEGEYIAALTEIFDRAEAHDTKPPPGLYAEYATLMYQKGDVATARTYYAKERDAWPESRKLMNTLISSLKSSPQTEQASDVH